MVAVQSASRVLEIVCDDNRLEQGIFLSNNSAAARYFIMGTMFQHSPWNSFAAMMTFHPHPGPGPQKSHRNSRVGNRAHADYRSDISIFYANSRSFGEQD